MSSRRGIYVAKQTFIVNLDGDQLLIKAHRTYVREGHALLKGREHMFRKVEPQYEVKVTKSPRPKVEEPLEILEPEEEE